MNDLLLSRHALSLLVALGLVLVVGLVCGYMIGVEACRTHDEQRSVPQENIQP
jgi:hypothetical protein